MAEVWDKSNRQFVRSAPQESAVFLTTSQAPQWVTFSAAVTAGGVTLRIDYIGSAANSYDTTVYEPMMAGGIYATDFSFGAISLGLQSVTSAATLSTFMGPTGSHTAYYKTPQSMATTACDDDGLCSPQCQTQGQYGIDVRVNVVSSTPLPSGTDIGVLVAMIPATTPVNNLFDNPIYRNQQVLTRVNTVATVAKYDGSLASSSSITLPAAAGAPYTVANIAQTSFVSGTQYTIYAAPFLYRSAAPADGVLLSPADLVGAATAACDATLCRPIVIQQPTVTVQAVSMTCTETTCSFQAQMDINGNIRFLFVPADAASLVDAGSLNATGPPLTGAQICTMATEAATGLGAGNNIGLIIGRHPPPAAEATTAIPKYVKDFALGYSFVNDALMPCRNLTYTISPNNIAVDETAEETVVVTLVNNAQAAKLWQVTSIRRDSCDASSTELPQMTVVPNSGSIGPQSSINALMQIYGSQLEQAGSYNIVICLDVVDVNIA
eukprot:g1740.t1